MYNHSDLEERLRKMLQAPLPGPKARKFEDGGSTDPEKGGPSAPKGEDDRIKRVTKKRFRQMTPEEIEEARAAGKIRKSTRDELFDWYSAMAEDARSKGDGVTHKKYTGLMDDMIMEDYNKKRERMAALGLFRRRKRILAPEF